MMHRPDLELTLDQARARGFVVDYPAHPRGVGCPIGTGAFGQGKAYPQSFDRFYVHRVCPFAGWLKRDDIDGTGTPAFKAGKTRADALEYIESRRSLEEVREAFRNRKATSEELAAAAERGRQTYPGDPHAARVYAAMATIDRDDDDVEWVNTGGNMMCLESSIDGRRVLVGEGVTAPDGFGWCVEIPCDGCCGVNYEIAINTSKWGIAQVVTALRAILENPTPTPLAIDLTGRGDFYNVAESEY